MRPDKTSPWLNVKKLASTLGGVVWLVTGVSAFADTLVLNPVKDNTLFEDSPTFSNGIGSYTFVGPITLGPSPALIADVSAWVNNPDDNHGWIAIGPEGPDESQKARRLVSRESPSTADRPQLTVEYTPPALQTRSIPALPPVAAAIFAALLAAIAHKRRIG